MGSKRWRWAGVLWWLTLMGLAGAGVVLSLSRGVWLASAIVAAGLVANLAWTHRRDRTVILAAAIGVTLVVGVFSFSDATRNRALDIARPVVELWSVKGRVNELSEISDRERAKLLLLGLQIWRESPWFGSGPASPSKLIRDNREQFALLDCYPDFHNLAVDMLASFGVVGSLPLLLTFVLVLWIARRGYRAGRLDRDLYITLVSLLMLSALAQMTDTRILSSHGRFYSMLLAGAAYSWWLDARWERTRAEKPSAGKAG